MNTKDLYKNIELAFIKKDASTTKILTTQV